METVKKFLPIVVIGGLIWFAATKIKSELVSKVVTSIGLTLATLFLVNKVLPEKVRSFVGQ